MKNEMQKKVSQDKEVQRLKKVLDETRREYLQWGATFQDIEEAKNNLNRRIQKMKSIYKKLS